MRTISAVTAGLYIVGWVLFVLAQAQNSVRSNTNGLSGAAGFRLWLRYQAVNLLTRAFFSAIFYGFVIQFVTQKLQAVGLSVHAYTVAGVGGYSANALLYQIFGLLPWLRVEVHDFAPPMGQQLAVPTGNTLPPAPPPNEPPKGNNP